MALASYIQQGAFKAFRMKLALAVDPSAFPARQLTQAQADAFRADVLVRDRRNADAQTLLDATLHDDPNNALAHEVMGFLKSREGDISNAKKWFGEAAQLDSNNFLAHYYYAALSLRDGDTSHDA